MRKRYTITKITKSYTRPRLCVNKSNQHIYAQIIDDFESKTLCTCSTLENKVRSQISSTSTSKAAKIVGHMIAIRSIQYGIRNVTFDRRNKPYHGKN